VRPGEAVRITATAWNALLDLLRASGSPQGGGTTAPGLPATVARLSTFYSHKCVLGEAVVIRERNGDYPGETATTPLSAGMEFSTVEKRLWNEYAPRFRPLTPIDNPISPEDSFAICIDPIRMRFVVSGLAWVRVRTIRRWHQYARRCIALPTDGATQLAAVAGCLDSCGWGPAEILGYAPVGFDPANGALTTITGRDSFTSGSIVWALVRI
jgi:hypothetical protein